MILETKFDIAEVVEIYQIEVEAVITEIKYDGFKICYCVEYWTNGCELKSVWQWENQLKKV